MGTNALFMAKVGDTWYASWKFADSYPEAFYEEMAPVYDTKAKALWLAKNKVNDEDMPPDRIHAEFSVANVTRALKAQKMYYDFYYVFTDGAWAWFDSIESLCVFLTKGTFEKIEGFLKREMESIDDWLGQNPKEILKGSDEGDEKLFSKALLSQNKFYAFFKDRILDDFGYYSGRHDEDTQYFYHNYVKRHKKEIIERLRGLLLKSYKMESLQESTGSGLPNRPPLVLCDHCVRGIKARGESLTQDEDFEIEEVDDGQGKCDWCGETHELSELSAYR